MPFASRISCITQVVLALSSALGEHHNAIPQLICDGEAEIVEKRKVAESGMQGLTKSDGSRPFAILFLVKRNCTDLPELDSLYVARLLLSL